ncbi:hypothetical protein J3R83DRAFT_1776 [Lanmaoa asiatica]|nr:hypothetical protein J3R83DRAFT_1776 [Lanmaoa asiatica]
MPLGRISPRFEASCDLAFGVYQHGLEMTLALYYLVGPVLQSFQLSLNTMVTVVQLDLIAAVVATGILATVLSGNSRRCLINLYQWLNGQVSGQQRLPDYSKLTGFPSPKPIYQFDIDSAKPRPYRPFRWEYHQTMCQSSCRCSMICPKLTVLEALKKLEPDWWIELESTYRERIDQRKKLYTEHGKLVIDELPGKSSSVEGMHGDGYPIRLSKIPQPIPLR